MLTFDAPTHKYFWRGAFVPNVTLVLQHAGLVDFTGVPRAALEYARERGRVVHKLTELDDLGVLDEGTIDTALGGFVDAWRRFRVENKYVPTNTEERCYHKLYRYAGTLDSRGFMRADAALLDKKTGVPQLADAYQTAAYLAMLPLCDQRRKRYAIYLHADGRYNCAPHTERMDQYVFFEALKNWKESYARH